MSTKKELIVNENAEATGVRFTFDNGETFPADLHALPEAMIYRLAVHGLSQKLGDSYAGAKGKGIISPDLFHQMQKTINTTWKFPGNLIN